MKKSTTRELLDAKKDFPINENVEVTPLINSTKLLKMKVYQLTVMISVLC